jgi:hypothetical protein
LKIILTINFIYDSIKLDIKNNSIALKGEDMKGRNSPPETQGKGVRMRKHACYRVLIVFRNDDYFPVFKRAETEREAARFPAAQTWRGI